MAFFGLQIVITMIMACILQKFSYQFSIGRWLLCYKLYRYLHPSDSELRNLAGLNRPPAKGKGKRGRHNSQEKEKETFLVPKSLELKLDAVAIEPSDMMQLRFYTEYQWLLDFSFLTLVVYFITEIYFFLLPGKDEANLSILWCLIVVFFTLKIMFSLTSLYFKAEDAVGERSLCLSAGLFFFLVSMVVLIIDENNLEFGLEPAYSSFSSKANEFLSQRGLENNGPASKLMFKLILAIWSGLTGAFLTFPGLRFSRMHLDTLKFCDGQPLMRVLLNCSFVSPLLALLMWIKPLARDYFSERIFPGMDQPIMSVATFETMRICIILGMIALRFGLIRYYLQSYLNIAAGKVDKLQKEAGRISNIDLQKMIANVYYYLLVVALQYVAPLLLCLFITLMFKTLGGYTWGSIFWESPDLISNATLPISQEVQALTFANLKKVFTPILYRGLLGYMTWWMCALWFGTSTVGLIYYNYFDIQ